MSKTNAKLAAVIDIGSNSINLKICQIYRGKITCLEYLEAPISLGHEVFTSKKINFNTIEHGINVLKSFYKLIDEYKIDNIVTVATTAFREAENSRFIADQILIKTGHPITVYQEIQETSGIFRELMRLYKDKFAFDASNVLMAHIGTGSVGLSICESGLINYTHNIRIGTSKLSEVLSDTREQTLHFDTVLEEYIDTLIYLPTDTNKKFKKKPIDKLVVVGKEIDLIARLCKTEKVDNIYTISKEKINELFKKIGKLNITQLVETYNISEDEAGILLPSLTIYKRLLSLTDAKNIYSPIISLWDNIMFNLLNPKAAAKFDKEFNKNVLASTISLAEHYDYDHNHAKCVAKYAVKIFDVTKSTHGLNLRHRLLLEIASLMHDIGKYANSNSHAYTSYDLIKNSSIIDLTQDEIFIIANLAKYHSTEKPQLIHENYKALSEKNKLVVAKLSAIIRLADSLDRSHLQKFSKVEFKYTQNSLNVVCYSNDDATLERFTFSQKSMYFQEVFGILCVFKQKGVK